MLLRAALLLTTFTIALAADGFVCKDLSSSGGYPYCVYVQGKNAPDGGAWPTMMFLPGSGARGDFSQASSLAGYDGQGKLIAQYLSGTKSGPQQFAAEQFLTIVPIASLANNDRHFFPDKIQKVLQDVQANYNVDKTKTFISGFSMGARGVWRNLVANPETWAAGAASAGAAENTGAGTLSQQYAVAVFPSLSKITGIPIRQFDGLSDTTAGFKDPQATQADLVKLGSKLSTLTEMSGKDHSAMSTAPWTDTDLVSWFLKQSRGKVASSTKTSAPKSTPTSVASGDGQDGEDDEDCEEEDETDPTDGDDEDCEDDENSDDQEEDCEQDETETPATKRSLPVPVARQDHHFVFPHSKRLATVDQHIQHIRSNPHVKHLNAMMRRSLAHNSNSRLARHRRST